MKTNQKHVLAAAMLRDGQQVFDAVKSRCASELAGDVLHFDPVDRVDDDVALIHQIAAADFHLQALPDADRAGDPPVANTAAKAPSENHATV